MRQILVSTEVFANIWACRRTGEESENDILLRILREVPLTAAVDRAEVRDQKAKTASRAYAAHKETAWWQVIETALEGLGGRASLHEIYKSVRAISEQAGRKIPDQLEATVRGTLEDNCAESHRYKAVRDIFAMPEGRGAGVWSLKKFR